MSDIYYVYALVDPRDYLPFYIGKGKGNRSSDHLKETKDNTSNIHKFNRIQYLKRLNLPIIIVKVWEQLNEQQAYEYEEILIRVLGRNSYEEYGILCNICINSQPPNVKGIKRSDEYKRNSSLRQKGKEFTDSHLANLRKSNRKGFLGQKHSAATLKLLREKQLGKKASIETRQKQSLLKKGKNMGPDNHMFGKSHTPETLAKMSASLTGKKRTDEFKDNLRKLHTGVPKQQVTCPHCGKTGGKPVMAKYHFDKCKLRCDSHQGQACVGAN